MRRFVTVLCAMLATGAMSCGGEGDPAPDGAWLDSQGPAIDARTDAETQSRCDTYCDCMLAFCGGSFADEAACLTTCAGLSEPALTCRIQHCGYAAGGMAAQHCPHARGEAICE
jgi:hypothetical protein